MPAGLGLGRRRQLADGPRAGEQRAAQPRRQRGRRGEHRKGPDREEVDAVALRDQRRRLVGRELERPVHAAAGLVGRLQADPRHRRREPGAARGDHRRHQPDPHDRDRRDRRRELRSRKLRPGRLRAGGSVDDARRPLRHLGERHEHASADQGRAQRVPALGSERDRLLTRIRPLPRTPTRSCSCGSSNPAARGRGS